MKTFRLLCSIALLAISVSANAQFKPSVRVLSEVGSSKNFCFGANFIAGFQTNDILTIGFGTGISYTDLLFEPAHYDALIHYYSKDYKETGAYIPVFATLKTRFMDTKVSPYFAIDLGYSFLVPFSDYARNYVNLGAFASPHAGVDFQLTKGSLGIEVGYKYQMMENTCLSPSGLNYSAATLALVYNF